ncbi:MAG TPA: hypothetical protein VFK08_00895, partial [Rhodanobacteraceae bacterium]|nr:hypothetical protein [Rhodanobacteraceae bacterium]
LSGKVTKAIGAGHDGLANIRLARLPVAPCAKRAGANSRIRALKQSRLAPAWRCDAPASCDGAGAHFDTAIHGLLFCAHRVLYH